jgi:glycosyltransferase involved in cell wall biosynthesis
LKILVVSNGFPPRGRWGTEFYTRELVDGLRGRGHELRVLHPLRDARRERYSIEETEEDGVPLSLLVNPGDPRKRFEASYLDPRVEDTFRRLLEREKPDLVHFTYLLWGLSVRLPSVARKLSIPSVVTLTDYGLLCHRGQMFDWKLRACDGPGSPAHCARCIREPAPFDYGDSDLQARRVATRFFALLGGLGKVVVKRDVKRRVEAVRAALTDVTRFIAPTEVIEEAFVSAGVPAERIRRLVYSFDETEYLAVRDVAPPRHARIGFLGQFAPHKGLAHLLDAAALVDLRRGGAGSWELVLHGAASEGRHRLFGPSVVASANRRRVRLGGPFAPEDAPRILAGFSAIAVPSLWDENAPLTVLQARAAGVPVIGSDRRGISEVLEDGRHGRIVPTGDISSLADAIEEVIDGKLGRLEEAGLPLSLDAHLDAVEEIHAEAIG